MMHFLFLLSVFVVLFSYSTAQIALENGVTSAPTEVSLAEEVFYELAPVADLRAVYCVTNGDSGNADLYLQWDARPSEESNDCLATGSSPNELCAVKNPGDASSLQILVIGRSLFAVPEFVITCTGTSVVDAENGESYSVALAEDQVQFYEFRQPENRRPTYVACGLRGEAGNANLFLGATAFDLSLTNFQSGSSSCASTNAGSIEACAVYNPREGSSIIAFVYQSGNLAADEQVASLTCFAPDPCPCAGYEVFCRIRNRCVFGY